MTHSLNYGQNQHVDLTPPEGSWVLDNIVARTPVSNAEEAVCGALREPIDFPSLDLMVLPDDEVAIALEPSLACAADLVSGTIGSLLNVGVPPELIQIVRTSGDQAVSDKQLLARLPNGVAERIRVVRHEPNNREALSFLGASKGDHPVYVNRTLCDASVVIPIGSHQSQDRFGCLGVHHSWFPTFADEETQSRFTKSLTSRSEKKIEKRKAECEEVAWMLGVQMLVQLVPAGNDQALRVLAGTPGAVWKLGHDLVESEWQVKVDRRASLVVAAIGGGPEQQTWENVVRAIDTALEAVEVDGTIAICCELKTKPGPALRRLAGAEDFAKADSDLQKKVSNDTLAASRLNHALQRARVYMLSRLEENDVEDLGIAYVSSPGEIAKLSTQYDSCLLLQDAQHASISLGEKVDA